ncbi:hypothetical protein ACFVWN_06755 [Nocardiopsis flavescens]|uniref:hypothetical protein n=1 Tax=Nocardiopsis flavescens TaxID=758803 RepID=UPI00365FCCEA
MRHLRAPDLAAVLRIAAGAEFTLNSGGRLGGDLLSTEFSTARRPCRATSGERPMGRVIPLRPDLAGWARPLADGAPLRLVPGRGRHHRKEGPVRLLLTGYTHEATRPTSIVVTAREGVTTQVVDEPPVPAGEPEVRSGLPRPRRSASRVRTYVAHPGGDMAPLALAVRSYLAR